MKKTFALFFLLISCIFGHAQSAQKILNTFLDDSAVRTGFAGISVYDPSSKKYILQYNADKNFMPSSNVKLFTLYAGMKYLGDSIPALRYEYKDSILFILPTGDPTLLHPNYKSQLAFDFLKNQKWLMLSADAYTNLWKELPYGNGWSWDDYNEDFMAERSAMPLYGNTFKIALNGKYLRLSDDENNLTVTPSYFKGMISSPDTSVLNNRLAFKRNLGDQTYYAEVADHSFSEQNIPFKTSGFTSIKILQDTVINYWLKKNNHTKTDIERIYKTYSYSAGLFEENNEKRMPKKYSHIIYSRPTDSLFRPMMFNSDNFFAEQTLLMVSNERLGFMSDEIMIDSLLKKDLKDIPTKPRWVDGSGLSRYNLFSPNDFVYILDKTEKEFGWQRLKNILPTGGQGTLAHYYENIPGLIYAKTGSMSNNTSISGFVFTKSNKKLIFSVIINNFSGSGGAARRAIEKLILAIREIN